ncbi:MAG TPA: ATP-binding protein [Gammaproteobacteria bacterium]
MHRELYGELFELSSDLMVIVEPTGRILEANRTFLNLVGYTLSKVAGESLAAFVHTDDLPRLTLLLERLVRENTAERLTLRCLEPDGESVCCDYTLQHSNRGPYLLAVGQVLDARHQRYQGDEALEQLIDERTRDLRLANAEMESFSFSISHDLRAPLRAIRGFATAIAEDHLNELGAIGRDYLQRILANCERMTTLTDYLLQLARMSRQELRLTKVNLGEMADAIIADLQAVEPERRVCYTRRGAMVVKGDRELLFTMLQNLIGNAWKYTAKRPRATIVFSSRKEEGETVFSVVDNGVGYPLALQERLFFLFQRLHDPNEYDGLGIGLPAAQRIVQRHGGRIWSECIEGERTAFYFTLKNKE